MDEFKQVRLRNQVPPLLGLIDLAVRFQSLNKEITGYAHDSIWYINKYLPEITDLAVYFPDNRSGRLELTIDAIKNRRLAGTRLFKVHEGQPWDVYLSGFSQMIPDLSEDPDFQGSDAHGAVTGSYFCIPVEQSNLKRVGVIALFSKDVNYFDEHTCIILGKLSTLLGIGLESYYSLKEAVEKSFRDELTGAYNRRFFNEQYDHEVYRHRRYKSPFSVLMLDIDYFKKLNDTYGHAIGDVVLRHVSRTINENIRKSDLMSRYGGEEFIVFLPDTSRANARLVAEKIRTGIEKLTDIGIPELAILENRVTVSIGIGSYPEHSDDKQELIEAADKNLYRAKHAGRNQVTDQ